MSVIAALNDRAETLNGSGVDCANNAMLDVFVLIVVDDAVRIATA